MMREYGFVIGANGWYVDHGDLMAYPDRTSMKWLRHETGEDLAGSGTGGFRVRVQASPTRPESRMGNHGFGVALILQKAASGDLTLTSSVRYFDQAGNPRQVTGAIGGHIAERLAECIREVDLTEVRQEQGPVMEQDLAYWFCCESEDGCFEFRPHHSEEFAQLAPLQHSLLKLVYRFGGSPLPIETHCATSRIFHDWDRVLHSRFFENGA
jgi:hypothetical protein